MSTEPTPPEPAAPEPTAPEATPINVPPIIESNQDDRTMAMLCHLGGSSHLYRAANHLDYQEGSVEIRG